MHANTLTVKVYYEDTDLGGVVYYANYLRFMERARTEWLRHLGVDQTRLLQDRGLIFVIVSTEVRYLRPLLLNQAVRVTACLREWEMRLVVDYKIEDADGVLCTKARTVQVPVDAETHELVLGSPQTLIDRVTRKLAETGLASP